MKGSQSGADLLTMMLWMTSSSLLMPKTSTSPPPPSDSRSTSISWALPEPDWSDRCLWVNIRGVERPNGDVDDGRIRVCERIRAMFEEDGE